MALILYRVMRARLHQHGQQASLSGQRVVTGEDAEEPSLTPCPHTLFIAHDEGYEYVADRARAQLTAKGFTVEKNPLDLIEIYRKADGADDEEEEEVDVLSPSELPDSLDFQDALNVVCYEGAPSALGVLRRLRAHRRRLRRPGDASRRLRTGCW